MKIVVFGIIAVLLIGSLNVQSVFAHNPDFEVTTTEDILTFCEFFYEEYQLLGSYDLAVQHPQFPNIRACVILYNHVAWNSTHEARDIVLIAEIEKYLGDSSYIKERHLEYSNILPEWVKRDARLWINNEKQDVGFSYGIRTMLEAGVLRLDPIQRDCDDGNVCLKEGDFIKYSHFDKYGNAETIKHSVKIINNEEIILDTEKISSEGITKEEIVLDRNGKIKTNECCDFYEFVVPVPISLGDTISDNVKIVGETTYTFENQVIQSWLASDTIGQNKKIIDKKTGLVFHQEYHETEVLSIGDETKITDTNFFNAKYNMDAHQVIIPEWLKTPTMWLLDERISESEYLRVLENLISRNILRV